MKNKVEASTPANTPDPIGPYNHIAKVGEFISIGGTAGVNPATGQLATGWIRCILASKTDYSIV
jgi:2-iminobutanoate/2-iminopropanoate deaminase